MLQEEPVLHSFLESNNIPLCGCGMFYCSVHQLRYIWIIFHLGTLVNSLYEHACMHFLFEHHFQFSGFTDELELLGWMVCLHLTYWGTQTSQPSGCATLPSHQQCTWLLANPGYCPLLWAGSSVLLWFWVVPPWWQSQSMSFHNLDDHLFIFLREYAYSSLWLFAFSGWVVRILSIFQIFLYSNI